MYAGARQASALESPLLAGRPLAVVRAILDRGMKLVPAADDQVRQPKTELVTRSCHVMKNEGRGGVEISKHPDVRDSRQCFFQQLEPLAAQFACIRHEACHVVRLWASWRSRAGFRRWPSAVLAPPPRALRRQPHVPAPPPGVSQERGRERPYSRATCDPTHFGRMLQELGIGFIAAQSPQAKGRIERLWGTLQDRLVSELRLRACRTLEQANAFLPEFLASFRQRFARPAAQPSPAWRRPPRTLDRILSCRYRRVVARDNTVRLGPRWLQLPPGPGGRSYAGRRVELRELLDGRLLVFDQGSLLAAQPAPAPAFVLAPRSDPNRDRPRRPRSPRAPARPLTAALAALAQTLRTPRAASAPAASPGERLAATLTRDRPRGRYVGTPPNGPNAVPASTPRAAPHHPWRTTFSPRQRRLNATKPG